MNKDIANKIKSGMKNFLRPKQMEKLNEVLDSILAEQNGTTVSQKDRDRACSPTTLRYANVQQSNVRYSHQKFIC